MGQKINEEEYRELRTALDAVDVILQYITQLDQANSEEELEKIFPGLLRSMGKYTHSDRSYIFDWTSEERDILHMTHEWCADGVNPSIGLMQQVRISSLPNWMDRFLNGELIVSQNWGEERLRMPEEYAVFDGQDIHALIVIPIFSNKKFNGYIGLDNPEQSTSAMSVRLLSAVGGHLGSLKENLRMVAALEEKQRRLKNSLKEQECQKARLAEALEEANRANMAKTDFLRRMSHDLRTPINGIQGMVEIAEHYADDLKKQGECRQKVREASGFLLDLVNSVLEMNKLESGSIVLEHRPFDLREILKEIDHITAMSSELKEVRLIAERKKIEHPYLLGSPLHLRQILQNIAENAVKYNRTGGCVRLSCEETGFESGRAAFRFVCEDSGMGMSSQFLPHVFEPFAQETGKARTSYTGTGLGLSITKQLVDMMGGTVGIESQLNEGTRFTVMLSFETEAEEQLPENVPEAPEAEFFLSGKHVLLAEDNDLNMEIARFLLENEGMRVTEAHDGSEAVQLFEQSPPGTFDVILMDIMMPVMDGLEASRLIRTMGRPDAKQIPILAMTANAFPEDVVRSREAGMNAHLAKPLRKETVLRAIRRCMAQ